MKKLFALLILLVYSVSISSLVHASTMGVFNHEKTASHTTHCHSTQPSTGNTKNNIDCCELVFSSSYSHVFIGFGNNDFNSLLGNGTISFYVYADIEQLYTLHKPFISKSPGRNTDTKYQKFSDLVGIIVDLA